MATPQEPIFITLKFRDQNVVVRVPKFPNYEDLKQLASAYFERAGNIALATPTAKYLILSQPRLQDLIDFGAFSGNKFVIEISEQASMFDTHHFKGFSEKPASPPRVMTWAPNPAPPSTESFTPHVHVFGGSWSQPRN
jgi:hypothetical protein